MFDDLLSKYTSRRLRRYDRAVEDYKRWLKTPEGLKASPEQQRLKRRSLFTATHDAVDPNKEKLRVRSNLIKQTQASDLRRMYELTRQTRPDLSAKSAFDVMVREHPNLIKNFTPEQYSFLYNRYVTQDPRRRGTDNGISNSQYDSNINPAENPNAAVYSGMANMLTTMKPAAEVLYWAPDFGVKAGAIGVDLAGKGLKRLGIDVTPHTGSAYNWLINNATIDKMIPAKTNEADAAVGDVGFDYFNRTNRALGTGVAMLMAAKQLPSNVQTAVTKPSRLTGSLTGLFSGYAGFGDLGEERTVPDSEIFGMEQARDPNTGTVLRQASSMSIDPVTGQLRSTGAAGTAFAPSNPGFNTVLSTLPDDHPLKKHQQRVILQQLKDMQPDAEADKVNVLSYDKDRVLAANEIAPKVPQPTSASNPDNPAPAGSPPPTDTPPPADKPKVSWWDSIDEEMLWRGGAAIGLGTLGSTLGGWKGVLAGSALAGLGYAYGDQLPVWWDKFMKAINTK